jgi:hypothetical protein
LQRCDTGTHDQEKRDHGGRQQARFRRDHTPDNMSSQQRRLTMALLSYVVPSVIRSSSEDYPREA